MSYYTLNDLAIDKRGAYSSVNLEHARWRGFSVPLPFGQGRRVYKVSVGGAQTVPENKPSTGPLFVQYISAIDRSIFPLTLILIPIFSAQFQTTVLLFHFNQMSMTPEKFDLFWNKKKNKIRILNEKWKVLWFSFFIKYTIICTMNSVCRNYNFFTCTCISSYKWYTCKMKNDNNKPWNKLYMY